MQKGNIEHAISHGETGGSEGLLLGKLQHICKVVKPDRTSEHSSEECLNYDEG